MPERLRRSAVVLTSVALMMGFVAAPAGAGPQAKNTQFAGSAVYEWSDLFGDAYNPGEPDLDVCAPLDGEFAAYTDFTMRIEGDLTGCWYTLVLDFNETPSGAYSETGLEVFVADDTDDMFWTTYDFHGKFDAEGNEIHGRCQHLVVDGTGMFEDATGRLDFKDDVDAGINYYRGHMKLPNAA